MVRNIRVLSSHNCAGFIYSQLTHNFNNIGYFASQYIKNKTWKLKMVFNNSWTLLSTNYRVDSIIVKTLFSLFEYYFSACHGWVNEDPERLNHADKVAQWVQGTDCNFCVCNSFFYMKKTRVIPTTWNCFEIMPEHVIKILVWQKFLGREHNISCN